MMTSIKHAKKQQDFADQALAMVKEKLGTRDLLCQLCGDSKWGLESQPAYVPVWNTVSDGTIVAGSKQRALSLLALTCRNCGNTLLLNTQVLGLNELVESDS